MSSTDRRSPSADTELPPALASMWRLCKVGYQHEPALMGVAFGLSLLAALPDALLAVWIATLARAVDGGDADLARLAAFGLAGSVAGTWFLGTVSTRIQRRFRDKVTIALESHVARLQSSITTIGHHERPEVLDRLSVLRNQVFVLDHMYMSVFTTAGWLLRLAVTLVLLASIHPVLVLLAAAAAPTVWTSSWRPTVERAAQERVAWADRRARHLFAMATTAAPAKEVRSLGIGDRIAAQRRECFETWYAPVAAARVGSAAWHTAGWAVFGAGFVGAIVFVTSGIDAPADQVLLVLAAGGRLSAYVGATVGEIGFLRGIWMDGARRLAWLEDYAATQASHADQPAPDRLDRGIRFEHVNFAYPGTSELALDDVTFDLPAGAVVAIVGENGAGKTTLVKLLSKFYAPSAGRILVDDTDLATIDADAWRARTAGAYQDFFRFELLAQHSIGLGDVDHLDDRSRVDLAVVRAGAEDVIAHLPAGLDTQLGPTWPGGVEVSFGQWQRLALARGFMRPSPLLAVLDEPTAALDAETEHALFERYAEAARANRATGAITVLVSHRFSTVRMADLIVVLDGRRVAEVGTHEDLMTRGGAYAELYTIQAASYR